MPRDRSKDIEFLDMPWPIAILAGLSALLVLSVCTARAFYKPYRQPSSSMEPAIPPGSSMIADKFAYAGERTPERGDIIVFRPERQPDVEFVKRVLGVSGDQVRLVAGGVVLNGKSIDGPPSEPFQMEWAGGDNPRVLRNTRRETLPGKPPYPVIDLLLQDVAGGAPTPKSTPGDDTQVYDVPKGHVFVLGDNRDNSVDSRFEMGGFGYVSEADISAKVVYILKPRRGSLRSLTLSGLPAP